MSTATRTHLTRDVIDYLVATASRSPSVNNTQPWQFRFHDDAIDLCVDPARRLRISDPAGRELVVSCGAALYTLRLAIRELGLEPRVRLLPDPDDPHVLARVTGLPGAEPTADESRLFRAITRRHTHRGPFLDRALDTQLLEDVKMSARLEGARLVLVPEGPAAERLVELAWTADIEQRTDISWRGEVRSWATPPRSGRRDGVPADAYPPARPAYDARQLPGRDFDLGRNWGSGEAPRPGASVLAVIVTDGDGPLDWLRGGAALQHVLLGAAANWVFAAFATQPLEVPEIRAAVRDAMRTSGFPQMVFRLGRATTATMTPRRPVRDVLIDLTRGPN